MIRAIAEVESRIYVTVDDEGGTRPRQEARILEGKSDARPR
jgi:hypothetical protein